MSHSGIQRNNSVRNMVDPYSMGEADLREELLLLQDNTKQALQESWKETEALREENALLKRSLADLQKTLDDCVGRETKLQDKVIELREKVKTTAASDSPMSSPKSFRRSSMAKMKALSTTNLFDMSSSGNSSCSTLPTSDPSDDGSDYGRNANFSSAAFEDLMNPDEPHSPKLQWGGFLGMRNRGQQQQQDELLQHIREMQESKQKIVTTSQSEIRHRDTLIKSLERASQAHLQTVEFLKSELEESKLTAEEQYTRAAEEIDLLRRKLVEKRKIIKKYERRLQ